MTAWKKGLFQPSLEMDWSTSAWKTQMHTETARRIMPLKQLSEQ